MQVVANALRATDLPRDVVATVGNYDGLHRGQRAVVDRVVARARELGAPSAVVTFEPHPQTVLAPETAPPALVTRQQKERLFAESGVDVLLVVAFTREFAATPAERFVREFLAGRLKAREIYVGRRFAFGRDREGNLDLLERLGTELGFRVEGLDELSQSGEIVSSTRIRRAIAEGRVEEAAELLGRPYALAGRIVRGDRMGKRLGWPTINVAPDNKLVPADGVYACRVFFPSYPATFDCVTNIGTRPTVYENYQRVVESHILDFKANVYGQRVELQFYKRLREERIFPTVMDLSAQIGRDVEATREYFAQRRRMEQETAPAALEGE